jgi:hypothetical protein
MSTTAGRPRVTVVAATLAACFVALAVLSHEAGSGTGMDHATLRWILHHRSAGFTSVAVFVTEAGAR